MTKPQVLYAFICLLFIRSCQSFYYGGVGNSAADGLFKKYGMMKIFEDCFGLEIIQEWWTEILQAGESCQSGKRMRPNNKIIPNIKHKHMKSPIKAQPLHFESAENVRFSSQEIRNPEYFQFLPVVVSPGFKTTFGSPANVPVQYPYYIGSDQPNYYYSHFSERQKRQVSNAESLETQEMLKKMVDEKVGNMTCIMRELKFLKSDNQPDVEGITRRINRLSIKESLKRDMLDGMQMCSDFSKCIPLEKYEKTALLRNLARPYMFFSCFKNQKLVACMKKDLNEKFGVNFDTVSSRMGLDSMAEDSEDDQILSLFSTIFGISENTSL
ncbi:uncharacterized protein LOC136038715 isoform X2 [Artemia franciscana]|uniref:Uncharacterized protein n=2 Tax=Artemia franciscana TaxID=6661 RepID=A0AA88HVU3_ARTSF|nr:hypothetical protein QYM36_006734 [Artemia franciscana]